MLLDSVLGDLSQADHLFRNQFQSAYARLVLVQQQQHQHQQQEAVDDRVALAREVRSVCEYVFYFGP